MGDFDSFLNGMVRDADIWAAAQASRGADGKPDPYKAAGMAAGMGYGSLGDMLAMGAILGSQGAFSGGGSTYSGSVHDDLYADDFLDGGPTYGDFLHEINADCSANKEENPQDKTQISYSTSKDEEIAGIFVGVVISALIMLFIIYFFVV
ncbi:MAG: hypothetical protein LUF26_07355 [Firmicutes bacterium]|nr:hypothetical protein [Bacillota bacterium]